VSGEVNYTALSIIVSSLLVLGGWLFDRSKGRQQHIFEQRLKYRLEMMSTVVGALATVNPPNVDWPLFATKLSSARTLVRVYGYKDEIIALENLVAAIETFSSENYVACHNKLVDVILGNLRRELKMGPIEKYRAGDSPTLVQSS
jgi:hypothetical protein